MTDWHVVVTPEHPMTWQAMFTRALLLAQHLALRGNTRHCRPLLGTTRSGTACVVDLLHPDGMLPLQILCNTSHALLSGARI